MTKNEKKIFSDSNYDGCRFWGIFNDIPYPTKRHMWTMLMDDFTDDSQAKSKFIINLYFQYYLVRCVGYPLPLIFTRL